jgi:hypothetical protein
MQRQRWDPSVKSLTALPQVLQMMNDKLDWTQQLGDAVNGPRNLPSLGPAIFPTLAGGGDQPVE